MTVTIALVQLASVVVAGIIWRIRGGSMIVGCGFGAVLGIIGIIIAMFAKPGDTLRRQTSIKEETK